MIDQNASEDDGRLEQQDDAIAAEEGREEGMDQESVDEDAKGSATIDAYKG